MAVLIAAISGSNMREYYFLMKILFGSAFHAILVRSTKKLAETKPYIYQILNKKLSFSCSDSCPFY